MPADHVHFNGSVNLADTETVMREITSRVPSGLRRLPDGETGDRNYWILFQLQKFLQLPWLVPDGPVARTSWRSTDAIPSWSWSGHEGRRAELEIYSADDEVELIVNGRSLGRRPAG